MWIVDKGEGFKSPPLTLSSRIALIGEFMLKSQISLSVKDDIETKNPACGNQEKQNRSVLTERFKK